MRILIIAPHYFPYNNPRALRWTAIAEEFSQNGHNVEILTSKGTHKNAPELKDGVVIHRIFYNSLKEILLQSKKQKTASNIPHKKAKKSIFQKIISQINQNIWRKIFFPDDACLWYFPAKNYAKKLLRKRKFDAVISVSLPFTTHLVGQKIKKKYPNIKWLADIGDPFSFQDLHPINNYFLFGKLNKKLEQNILELADNVVVTNEGAKNLYFEKFENLNANISVIPPLLHNKRQPESLDFQPEKGKIRLGYFGRFFKKIREPFDGLAIINEAIKRYPQPSNLLEIHFFGEGFEAFSKEFEQFPKLKDRVFFHGLLPRNKVAEIMHKMDFLLNFGNATTHQLPSKSVDYIISGKPIINFQAIKSDTFKAFFKDYSLIVNLLASEEHWQEENIRRFVSFLWEAKNKRVNADYLAQKVEEYSEKAISKAYFELLKSR